MNPQLFYLVTILAFAGSASVIGLIAVRRNIRKYAKLLVALPIIALIATPIYEPVAIYWKAWAYGEQYMLNVHFLGAEVETYLYSALVILCIGCATLAFADAQDRGKFSLRFFWEDFVGIFKGSKR